MIVVTGGAGFIGSCVVRTLNDAGRKDIIIVDHIGATEKWRNLSNKRYSLYIPRERFLTELDSLDGVEAVIHMGARSSTTETNFDYLLDNNFYYTKRLWEFCAERNAQFIYASSAATYGDGSNGFDDEADIDALRPLNAYGYSKQMFDLWAKHEAKVFPPQRAGLKFFNVYGPNEYYKGNMASMVFHGFGQIQEDGEIRLFKSCNPQYADGGQLRDFVYVKDVCKVILWLLEHPTVSGLFNVGTGRAQSFRELAEAVFHALNLAPNIRYIDMPEHLREKYQYYTRADMAKLRGAGYQEPFADVSAGVSEYVKEYLRHNYAIY